MMISCVRIGIAASMMGVCTKTVRRWDAAGKITCTRTTGGHRRISLVVIGGKQDSEPRNEDKNACERAAVYCRVSSHEQKAKGDLDRQVATATRHCVKTGFGKPTVFTDVGSGLNATRQGLARLCKQVETGQVRTVVVSFKDRLTRFGFEYLRRYFASHGASIVVARQSQSRSMQDELVEDLIAILTSFSGRVHGMRGKHAKKSSRSCPEQERESMMMDRLIKTCVDATVDELVRNCTGKSQPPGTRASFYRYRG